MWHERRLDWKRVLLTTVAALLVLAALSAAGLSSSMQGGHDAAMAHGQYRYLSEQHSGV